MPTEFQVGKNATLSTTLTIGETVINYIGGYKTMAPTVIEGIKRGQCETGIMVKTSNYNGYVDSNWINNPEMAH
jgi:hypothetical protein